MLKIKMWKNIKPFLQGFDYGVKHYSTIEDKHFFTYFLDSEKSPIYRSGINVARRYIQYRNEILTIVILMFIIFLFLFT